MSIPVYSSFDDEEIIGHVKPNSNLDYWDGHNWTNGGTGLHKGLTRLKNGNYVIIITSQWQGSKDYGFLVSEREALQEILKSGRMELLEEKKFKDLKDFMDKNMLSEMEDEEEHENQEAEV
jgi:hypothetical protein